MNAPSQKRILVLAIRAIGDIALVTPVPRILKQKFPTAYVGMLVDGPSSQVLQCNPHLDRVFLIDRVASRKQSLLSRIRKWFCLVSELRKDKFDIVVDLFSGPRSAWLAWFCGAPARFGEDFRASLRGCFYNHPIKIVRDNRHLVQQKFKIIQPLVGVIERGMADLEIHVTELEKQAALAKLLKGNGELGKRIGFIPGAGSHWRIWPAERFAELGDRLIKHYDREIILLGGLSEIPLCQRVADLMSNNPLNLSGQTTLRELIALLSELDLVISNVTGPLHLASALKKPKVIGLYGAADTIQYAPWGTTSYMLTKGKPSEAYWKKVDYQGDHEHLLKITVEDVLQLVGRIFFADKERATLPELDREV